MTAVDKLSFECAPGEIFGLVGPDGAGKTTIMRMLAGVMAPDEGAIAIDGVDVVAEPERVRSHVELHAAALRPLRGPDGRREHRVLRRSLRHSRKDREERAERLLAASGMTPFRSAAPASSPAA